MPTSKPQLKRFARNMRNNPTDAEHTLWQHLYIPSPSMGEGQGECDESDGTEDSPLAGKCPKPQRYP